MQRIALAIFALALNVVSANAANLLFISEYNRAAPQDNSVIQVAVEPALVDQTPVNYGAGAATSAAFGAQTNLIRLMCDTRCAIRISTAGTAATTSNKPMAADTPEYFGVRPGDVVSVIASP